MTPQELLKPRIRVENDYPGSPFKVGEILHQHINKYQFTNGYEIIEHIEKYPHLFKPLPWWMEREEKDMPEYLKHGSTVWKFRGIKKYTHYRGTDNAEVAVWNDQGYGPLMKDCTPATEEEYDQQNKS